MRLRSPRSPRRRYRDHSKFAPASRGQRVSPNSCATPLSIHASQLTFSRALRPDILALQEDKIKTLTEAAGITVEPYWPSMFAKLLETVKIDDLINNIGAAPASGAAPAAGAAGGDVAAAEEEKKEESEEEEEEEMDFDLFD